MLQRKIICFLIFVVIANAVMAQLPATDTSGKNGKKLDILYADVLNFLTVDSLHQFISLVGKKKQVLVKQEKTLFYADSAILNQTDNTLEAFGNIHINDADSVHTYSQYLKYLGKEKKAFLKNKVRLTDGKGVLTTDDWNMMLPLRSALI